MKKFAAFLLAMLLCAVSAFGALAEELPAARTEATEFVFELAEEEQRYVENLIFAEPVTISGDNAQIVFVNCMFFRDIVLTSQVGTRVMLLDGCVVAGDCVLDNGQQEATMETSLPKFLTAVPVVAESRDCYGTIAALADFEIMFNGEIYRLADSELFFDNTAPENGMVPYEGQEANCFVVAQWWENGEQVILTECEYAPE